MGTKLSLNTKRILKIAAWTVLTLFLLVAAVCIYLAKDSIRHNYLADSLETEFDLRVEKSIRNVTNFDLTDFDLVQWNQLFFIFPYQDTEHLTFKYQGPFISSTDDGEMYIVLMNDDEYVARISGVRGKIDFSTCGNQECLQKGKWMDGKPLGEECRCRGKIRREEAIFEIDHSKGSYRKVKLKVLSEGL